MALRRPARRTRHHQVVMLAQRSRQRFVRIQQQVHILPRLNRPHEQHKRPLQSVPRTHLVHTRRRRIEKLVRHPRVDRANLLRRDPQRAHRVLPRALRYRNQSVGPPRQLRETPLRHQVRTRVQLRHQKPREIVYRGRQSRPRRRMPHQHARVKHVRAARHPIHQRCSGVVRDRQRGQPAERAQRTRHRSLVVQRAYPFHRRKRADRRTARGAPQMQYPMKEVILDARAAHQQRCGINDNAHAPSVCHECGNTAVAHGRRKLGTDMNFRRTLPEIRCLSPVCPPAPRAPFSCFTN